MARKIEDFVGTISDSEEGVPNLDSEDEEMKNDKQSKDLNPDFIFAVDDLANQDAFVGWDFKADVVKDTRMKKRDVDLESIIKRKGGLSGRVKLNGEDEEEEEEEEEDDDDDDDEEEEQEEDVEEEEEDADSEEEDELAMDGFGMGAKSDIIEENDEEEEEEEEEDPVKVEEANEGQTNLSDDDDVELVEKAADSQDAIAEYYEQNNSSNKSVHATFQSLNLSRPILKSLMALNYSKPTPIQSASIPIALLGKDIVAGAVTGSGKTAAYIIPVIERLIYKPSKIAKTRVIVLTPTRELAIQVADVGRKLAQYVNGVTFGLAVGGLNLRQQEQELKQRPDIVVATPGRLIDHIRNSPSFSVDDVEIVIMDEADRMLEEGFEKEMQEIVSLLPTKRQTMLFSATMNSNIKQLISWSLKKPVRIMIDPPKTAAVGLTQEFVRIRKKEVMKPALLYTVLAKLDTKERVIVFVSTKDMCHKLRISMGLLGLRVVELHGGLTQEQRLQAVTDFKSLAVPVLICTDLAARGLDIPKIEVVINFDMPKTHEIYLHRVGRTARAGREGISVSFVGEAKRDRAIVKEVIKNVEDTKQGKAVGRNVDWKEIERIDQIVLSKKDTLQEIIEEEKQEREVIAAEMELKKGENLLRYRDEIGSRPKRTWFMSEKDKQIDKNRVHSTVNQKKINSKKRKREEAISEDGGRSYKKTGKDRFENDHKRLNKLTVKKLGKKGGKKGGKR